jgi:hypothetical protein
MMQWLVWPKEIMAKFQMNLAQGDYGEVSNEFVRLESPRRFVLIEHDFTGMNAARITETAVQLVKSVDQDGVIIIPVLKGTLLAKSTNACL